MADVLRDLISLLDPAQRRSLALQIVLGAVSAIVDAAAVSLTFLIVQAATQPASLAEPGALGLAYRWSGADTPSAFLVRAGLAVVMVLLVKSLYAALLHRRLCSFCSRGAADLAIRLCEGYLNLSYTAFRRRHSADLIRHVRELGNQVFNDVAMGVIAISVEILVLVVLTVALLVVQPLPTLLAGSLLLILLAIETRTLGRLGRGLGRRHVETANSVQRTLQEGLGGFKETRMLGREREVAGLFAREQRAFSAVIGRQLFLSQLHRFVNEAVMAVAVVAVVAVGLWRGRDGIETLAPLAVFAAAAFRMIPAANRIMYSLNVVRHYQPSLALAREELRALDAARATSAEPAPPVPFEREIRCEHLTYAYPGSDAPAVDDVSFTIPRGASFGIAGDSGAGKSTLTDLLIGLLPAQSGRVLVDGLDIADRRRGWQARIGYVPAHVHVADETLRRNVAYGVPDAEIEDARVWEALRLAHLDTFVAELPDGLATRLGERGARLSDGQRQRVGIARALYRQPSVVVFDEATSALDIPTEHALTQAIRGLRGRVTLIVVAHRLNTIRACDQVLLMRGGRGVQVGAFDELAAHDASFSEAVALAGLDAGRA